MPEDKIVLENEIVLASTEAPNNQKIFWIRYDRLLTTLSEIEMKAKEIGWETTALDVLKQDLLRVFKKHNG